MCMFCLQAVFFTEIFPLIKATFLCSYFFHTTENETYWEHYELLYYNENIKVQVGCECYVCFQRRFVEKT